MDKDEQLRTDRPDDSDGSDPADSSFRSARILIQGRIPTDKEQTRVFMRKLEEALNSLGAVDPPLFRLDAMAVHAEPVDPKAGREDAKQMYREGTVW